MSKIAQAEYKAKARFPALLRRRRFSRQGKERRRLVVSNFRRCKGTYYFSRLDGFETVPPVLSRDSPNYPAISRQPPSVKAQKKHQKILLMLIKLQICSVLFRIAITEMLFAITITSWHTQSYQLVIHVCCNRRQHYLSLLLQFFEICAYFRHPLVSHKPFYGIVNTPRLIIFYLWVNEMKPLLVPLQRIAGW